MMKKKYRFFDPFTGEAPLNVRRAIASQQSKRISRLGPTVIERNKSYNRIKIANEDKIIFTGTC